MNISKGQRVEHADETFACYGTVVGVDETIAYVVWDAIDKQDQEDDEPDAVLVAALNCLHARTEYVAHVGAPGYGQSHKCIDCGEAMWTAGCGIKPVPYASLEQPPELSINDII
jgi:hypothetical protein